MYLFTCSIYYTVYIIKIIWYLVLEAEVDLRKHGWSVCVDNDRRVLRLKREMTKDQDLWRSTIHGNRPTCASMEKRTLRRYIDR